MGDNAIRNDFKRDPGRPADGSLELRLRRLANRWLLKISGRWFRAYSILEHVGRSSGRVYRNPVSAYPLGDGYVVAVLYGSESHWVCNAMAAGGFTVETKGRRYQLERPELVTPEVALPAYSAFSRQMMRTRKIQNFMWAHQTLTP